MLATSTQVIQSILNTFDSEIFYSGAEDNFIYSAGIEYIKNCERAFMSWNKRESLSELKYEQLGGNSRIEQCLKDTFDRQAKHDFEECLSREKQSGESIVPLPV